MRVQDGEFAARRVIFRQLGDLFEQPRASLVVEIFWRQALGPRRQAGDDIACELRLLNGGFVSGDARMDSHHRLR